MKYTAHYSGRLAACVLTTLVVLAGDAFAQVRPNPGGTRGPAVNKPATPAPAAVDKPAPAAPVAAKSGAEAIEDKLMYAMARREMNTLLGYYAEKNKIAADKINALKGTVALEKLLRPDTPALEKHKLLHEAVKGTDIFLAHTTDTEALMNIAGIFIEAGVKSQMNQIEYFGPSPMRQAELNETASAVKKILDKVVAECEAQQNAIVSGRSRADDSLTKKWQDLDNRLQAARWTNAFSAYGLALSMDPASPKRKETAQAAIAFLKEFEAPEFQREGPVRIQIGKLHMVAGEHDSAVKKWDEAVKKPLDKVGHYDIKFYTALNALLAKRDKAADAAMTDLQQWCKTNLTPAEQKEVSTGVGLLEYRINEMKADATKDAKLKQQYGAAGEAALSRVMKDNPKLEPVIKRMLLEKLPADADITKLDTVLLRALMAKGVDEFLRAGEGPADEKGRPIVERAVKAARELQKRKGQPAVTEDVEDEASFLEAMLLGKLRKPENSDAPDPMIDAITASLRYVKERRKSPERAQHAMANALACVEVLRRNAEGTRTNQANELINQTWETAMAMGQKQLAYIYGRRLFDQAQYKQAATILRQIPPNHPHVTPARFYELTSLQNMLNEKDLTAAARQQLVDQIQKLAADVNKRIDTDMASANADQKIRLNIYKVSSSLLAAELALNELKKPDETLKMLQGVEDAAKGLPGELQLIGSALNLRVTSLMALNRTQDAVGEVKKLVESGSKGAARVLYEMLKKMDDSYVAAQKVGDKERMRTLSGGQAALIAMLIEQTKEENIKDQYKNWQARLLLRAARQETDQARRTEYLKTAQTTFTELMGKAAADSPEQGNLRYQLALISFELKDYKTVSSEMGQLIAAGKLGPADLNEKAADGSLTVVENPVYWEGVLRFMQANYELSKADPGSAMYADAVKRHQADLKMFYINRGSNVGGARFRDEYAQFKKVLLGDWDESKVQATQPSTQPAK